MTGTTPFSSREVRWFFNGKTDRHESLKRWFETTTPVPKDPGAGPPEWRGRRDDRPDVYLLVPGSDDMGIKWREGLLQIKGRVSPPDTRKFCERHAGTVERWVKWSYASLPDAYRRLFATGRDAGPATASVRKVRALRKVRLDPLSGKIQEVRAEAFVHRGVVVELTDLEVGGRSHCSLAFEAFPDDAATAAAFTRAVEAFLETLTEPVLSAADSRSYPAWLGGIR